MLLASRCARPPRRARIATHRPRLWSPRPLWCCARPPRRARIATTSCGTCHHLVTSAAPGHRAGRGSQHGVSARFRTGQQAAAPGHRAGRGSQPGSRRRTPTSGRRLRPATAPGEDRNSLRAQRPLLSSPSCARPPRRARIATGDARPQGGGGGSRCARPPRRARIATPARRTACARTDLLRPATAPGEDRNTMLVEHRWTGSGSCARPPRRARIATRCRRHRRHPLRPAAPGHRAGRGSQPVRPPQQAHRRGVRLRPATAPGEDRNGSTGAHPLCVVDSCARPPRRARIATDCLLLDEAQILGRCARPPRRARIATVRNHTGAARPLQVLRPATAPGEDRNSAGGCAATPTGSRLRPATAPGEDRNRTWARAGRTTYVGLRPATAPGEDRNLTETGTGANVTPVLRPATAPGEDRNAAFPPRSGRRLVDAAPGHRAGRGSQRRPGGRGGAAAAAAPGHRAGRGSQRRARRQER